MIIPHACNTEFLDPARVLSKDECRVKYFLKKNAFYLAFVGTPRGHKGLDMILDFLHKHSTPDLRLLIAGIQDQEIKSSFYDKCRSKIDFITTFSRKNLPEIIKAIDVSLILQKDLACCKGQLPAKLFDAMAMEKPVIASAVSDIPEILDGCGITITPDNMQEFEKAVKKIRDNKENAFQMGKKGRIKCIQKYSQKVVSERLKKYVNQILFKK
jgi:glycosyltransferase involved in cell wall biosynthesis